MCRAHVFICSGRNVWPQTDFPPSWFVMCQEVGVTSPYLKSSAPLVGPLVRSGSAHMTRIKLKLICIWIMILSLTPELGSSSNLTRRTWTSGVWMRREGLHLTTWDQNVSQKWLFAFSSVPFQKRPYCPSGFLWGRTSDSFSQTMRTNKDGKLKYITSYIWKSP